VGPARILRPTPRLRRAAHIALWLRQSTYLWEGKVNRDPELLLMVKTRSELTKTLAEFVQEHHPYDVPEVICSEISEGLPAYLQWVRDSTNADL